MQTQEIGQSGILGTRLALGVMRMASLEQSEANEVVETALQTGINFFDSADIYTKGESSRKLGQALRDLSVDRSSIFVQTKVGIHRTEAGVPTYDFSCEHILAAVDFELNNLQTDYVDFLLLHRPDTLVELDELGTAFAELKSSGKVRHFGVSNVNPAQVELLQSATTEKLEVNQLQFGLGHTGMIQQEMHVNMEDGPSLDHDGGLLAYSRLKHMTIQAWSPLQYGFFEGAIVGSSKYEALNEELDALAASYKVSPAAIAIAWILRHPAKIQVLLGSMKPKRIREMSEAAKVTLTREEWYKLYQAAGNDLP